MRTGSRVSGQRRGLDLVQRGFGRSEAVDGKVPQRLDQHRLERGSAEGRGGQGGAIVVPRPRERRGHQPAPRRAPPQTPQRVSGGGKAD